MKPKYRYDLPGAFIKTMDDQIWGRCDASLWDNLPRYKKTYHLLMGTKNKFIFIVPFKISNDNPKQEVQTTLVH